MSKENVDLVRKQLEALDRRDLDGVMNSVAEDTVLDSRPELTRARPAFEPEVVPA
jgi:ketosteroid isomerase-like protein